MPGFLSAWSVLLASWQPVNANANLKLAKLFDEYESAATDPKLILADLSESNRVVSSEFTDAADNSMFVTAASMMFRKGLETQLHSQARKMEAAVRASIERESTDAAERQELESALQTEVAMAFTEVESTLDKRIQSAKTYHRIRQIQADLAREMVLDLRLQISRDIQMKISSAQHPAIHSKGQQPDAKTHTTTQQAIGHSNLRKTVTGKLPFRMVASAHAQTASGSQSAESATALQSPGAALHHNGNTSASTISTHDGQLQVRSAQRTSLPFTSTNASVHRGEEHSGSLHLNQKASMPAPQKPTLPSGALQPAEPLEEALREHVRPGTAHAPPVPSRTTRSPLALSLHSALDAEMAFAQSSEEDNNDGALFSSGTYSRWNNLGSEPRAVNPVRQHDSDLMSSRGTALIKQQLPQHQEQQQRLGEIFVASVAQPMRRLASWLSAAWKS